MSWAKNYLRFLAKRATSEPVMFFKDLPAWQLYLFLPHLTRSPGPPPVLNCSEVERAVEIFYRDGFVVLSDALEPDETQKLYELVKSKADWIEASLRDGTLPPELKNGPNRYSFDEFAPCTEWEYLAHNEKLLPIIKAIWKDHGFRAVATGGDFLFPGSDWQPLHNDHMWRGAGERVPPEIVANYYVTDIEPINGPIRQVPGTACFPTPNRWPHRQEPPWMKQALVTGKAGYAVLRDQRAWHGGTPNTSDKPRCMPNVTYVRSDAGLNQVGSTQGLRRLKRGEWIAEWPAADAS